MKLKTLINKLENERIKFVEKYGVEPSVFDLSSDEFDRKIEITITSKVSKWDYGTMSDKDATEEIKVKY